MKKNTIIIVILLVLVCAFWISKQKNTFEGMYSRRYEVSTSSGNRIVTQTLDFKEDGKMKMYKNGTVYNGEYEKDGKNLVIYLTILQQEFMYTASIHGDKIIVDEGKNTISIAGTFTKE